MTDEHSLTDKHPHMESFIIEGGHQLSGSITPQGAKNEALEVICASLLTSDEVRIKNIPDISICQFTEKDVVRHKLVQEIIKAYEKNEEAHRK